MDQVFQFTDMSADVIVVRVEMLNYFTIRCDSVFQIMEGLGGFLLHGNIGTI